MISPVRRLGILTLLLGFNILNQLLAQDFSELYALYQQKDFITLQQKTQQIADQYPDKDEVQFFKALFLENGDEAIKIYEQLYPRAVGILKTKLSEKLTQYYYARGLYVRAAEFDKTPAATTTSAPSSVPIISNTDNAPTAKPIDIKKGNYIIQVGAFGEEENARQLQNSLHQQKINSQIVKRIVNERNLYCVWVTGGNSLDETLRIADKIKNRFKLEYRILKN